MQCNTHIYMPYVCTYVCMYVRMYVCLYVCMYVRTYVRTYVCMCVCVYVCMCVCVYVYMYVCMYVCMYVRTYVCLYMYMYIYIYACTDLRRTKGSPKKALNVEPALGVHTHRSSPSSRSGCRALESTRGDFPQSSSQLEVYVGLLWARVRFM